VSISRLQQFGYHSSGNASPKYHPTLTDVLQKPEVCLERHILYMSALFFGRVHDVPNLPCKNA
jgi:hypothetical protein